MRKDRFERLAVLWSRLLDTSIKGIITQEVFAKLRGRFMLDYGISIKTFGDYLQTFIDCSALSNNISKLIERGIDPTPEFPSLIYWKLNPDFKFPNDMEG